MTEKQKLFADEYLIDLNATRAYKAVYKSIKNDETAKAASSRLLTNVNVKKYIDERLEKIKSDKIAETGEIMEYLTSVMRGKSSSHVLMLVGDGCQKIVEKPPDEKERLKAAELLGKRYSLFTERVKLDGNEVVKIIDDIPKGNKDEQTD